MFGNLCNNSSAATLAVAQTLMNDSEKRIIAAKDWPFLWRQYTVNTAASTSTYKLPSYTQKPQGLYITVGAYRYVPDEVTNSSQWDDIAQVVRTSDIPEHYRVYDGSVEIYPRPTTAGNVITFNGRRVAKDLLRADYTTGTIVTLATAATITTVTGSGTTWSAAMIGRWIRIDGVDAANAGDNFWYEIATVPSATTLTLVRTYGGTAISAGSATYTIGEVSLIPEPHDQLPVFEALKIYFTSIDPDPAKSKLYGAMFEENYAQMFKDYTSKTNVVLDDGGDTDDINPNLQVTY